MISEENKTIENIGEKLGYIFSYFVFTTILFFILIILKKISGPLSYVYVMVIVTLISVAGIFIKRFLR